MDGLSGNVFTAEVGVSNGGGDVVKMHRLFFGFENDIDFVADVFRVDGGPFGETPKTVKRSEGFGERSDSGDLRRVLVGKLGVEFV